MKKAIPLILILCFILSSCSLQQGNTQIEIDKMEYRKAIWIAYYELSEMTNGKDKYEFEKTIKEEL